MVKTANRDTSNVGRPAHPKNDKTWVGRFGGNVRDTRTKKGWSLNELSEKSGLEYSFLSELERGLRDISVNDFSCICDAFGVKPSALLPKQGQVEATELGSLSLTFLSGLCAMLRRNTASVAQQIGEAILSEEKVRQRVRKKAI